MSSNFRILICRTFKPFGISHLLYYQHCIEPRKMYLNASGDLLYTIIFFFSRLNDKHDDLIFNFSRFFCLVSESYKRLFCFVYVINTSSTYRGSYLFVSTCVCVNINIFDARGSRTTKVCLVMCREGNCEYIYIYLCWRIKEQMLLSLFL